MIFDNIKNYKQYCCMHKNFQKAFDFLVNSDLKNMTDGKYQIDGDLIYANVQTLKTKPIEEKKWEVHRDYIDIQYLITGKEKMGYGLLKDYSNVVVPYDKEKDIEFLNGAKFNFVDVFEENFVIFYPNDVHAPMLSVNDVEEIKKVIVKIKK